jgi:chromosome partitioning protein
VVPSALSLAGAEIEFASQPGRELLLKEALAGTGGYDYIFLDCPPNLGLLTVMALTAAQGC